MYWNSADRRNQFGDKFSDLYKDALRRKERQDKIYSACITSECTFKPDTTVSKYYYQRLESRDPGYTQHRMNGEEPLRKHYRNLSEGLSEKDRLHRSLKKSSTLSNDLFDPDSGLPFRFKPRVGRGPKYQNRPDPHIKKGATGQMLYD